MADTNNTTANNNADDWCTIESDPAVFTELLETLGCTTVELKELYSLDDDSLAALISQHKVYGLIFLFQWKQEQEQQQAVASKTKQPPLAEDDIPPNLFFAHQVTTNACATQAILSVLLNAASVELGEELQEFKTFTSSFPPNLKGVAISSSESIKKAHNSFARPEAFWTDPEHKPRIVDPDQQEAFHFVAYVPVEDKVYELDGLQKGPIVVGSTDDSSTTTGSTENDSSLAWIQQARTAIQERMQQAGEQHVKFNLMAVIQDARVPLQEALAQSPHDAAAATALAHEQAKREQWRVENQRRRHNYVPLCVQLLKELARQGKLAALTQQARDKQEQKRSAAAGKK